MKKILSLLALVLMSCMGAWADYITPDEGVYQFQNTGDNRGYLAYYNSQSTKPVLAGVTYSGCTGTSYTVATNASGVNLNFGLIRSPKYENVYYIFSVETGKFLSWKLGENYAKFSIAPTPWKIYERSIDGTTYQLLTTDNFVSASGNGNFALSFACGTTMANGQLRAQSDGLTSSSDGGLKNKLNKQTATSAQEEMMAKARRSIQYYEYEEKTSVASLSNTETYVIRNIADNRGFLAYNSASSTCVGLADVTYNDNMYNDHAKSYDENTGMLWNIIKSDNNTYALYNKKIQKYVSVNSNNKCVWSDTPTNFTIEYLDGTFRIKTNDLYVQFGCGWAANNNPVYLENNSPDNSQKLIIGKVEESINSEFNGKFVRFYNAGKYQKDRSKHYIAGATATTNKEDAASVYYIDGNKMLQYSTGLYMKAGTGVGDPGRYASQYSVVMGADNASAMAITAHATEANCYKISSGLGSAVAYWDTRDEKIFNHTDVTDIWSHWYCEEVTSLPVTIAASGYTTFYAPVAIQVPEGTTAYAAAIDDYETTITYTPFENNIIPAGKGALLKGEGSVNLAPTTDAATSLESALVGHEYTEACSQTSESHGEKYIYTLQSGIFQYYTGTKLSGFKAHLELNQDHRGSNSNFRVVFVDETLTNIEANEVAPINNVVYDLQGRRVQNAKSGLYIVNGKKVVR